MDQLKDTKSSQRNSTVATPTLTSPTSLLPHQKGPSAMALREDRPLQTHIPALAKGQPRDIQTLHANHLPGCGPRCGATVWDCLSTPTPGPWPCGWNSPLLLQANTLTSMCPSGPRPCLWHPGRENQKSFLVLRQVSEPAGRDSQGPSWLAKVMRDPRWTGQLAFPRGLPSSSASLHCGGPHQPWGSAQGQGHTVSAWWWLKASSSRKLPW